MTTEYIEDQTGQNLVQIAFPISKPLTIFPKNFLETKRLCRRLVSERMVVLYGGVFLAPPPPYNRHHHLISQHNKSHPTCDTTFLSYK
jgi:hypothetical protein